MLTRVGYAYTPRGIPRLRGGKCPMSKTKMILVSLEASDSNVGAFVLDKQDRRPSFILSRILYGSNLAQGARRSPLFQATAP